MATPRISIRMFLAACLLVGAVGLPWAWNTFAPTREVEFGMTPLPSIAVELNAASPEFVVAMMQACFVAEDDDEVGYVIAAAPEGRHVLVMAHDPVLLSEICAIIHKLEANAGKLRNR